MSERVLPNHSTDEAENGRPEMIENGLKGVLVRNAEAASKPIEITGRRGFGHGARTTGKKGRDCHIKADQTICATRRVFFQC